MSNTSGTPTAPRQQAACALSEKGRNDAGLDADRTVCSRAGSIVIIDALKHGTHVRFFGHAVLWKTLQVHNVR